MNRQAIVECHELSPLQKQLVRETLRSMIESPQFSKSKRYPALLEYIVDHTLSGETEALKERILATEVFGRSPSYDSSADAIVRTMAGEVRRRMAAYFSEHPEAHVRIDLPLGGYIPEFRFAAPPNFQPPVIEQEQVRIDSVPSRKVTPMGRTAPEMPRTLHKWRPARIVALTVVLMAFAGTFLWSYFENRAKHDFWRPVLRSGQPVILVVGRHGDTVSAGATTNSPAVNLAGRSTVILQDVRAVAQICSDMHEIENDCNIASAPAVTLEELQGKSVILIGAYNNAWTRPLLASLPYQIPLMNPAQSNGDQRRIVEHKNSGDIQVAAMGNDDPDTVLGRDFAVIGRFHSTVTNGMVVVIAGLGPEGTRGAAEFVSSPDQIARLVSLAPKSWNGLDFEAVLQVDVIQGSASSAKVLGARFWQ